jgi:hypothetical protein
VTSLRYVVITISASKPKTGTSSNRNRVS